MLYNYSFRLFILSGLMLMLCTALQAQNVLYTQTFGECVMPDDWSTMVEYGGADWRVDDNIRVDPDYGDKCFLYFPDFRAPGKGDSSSIWAFSPWVKPINSDKIFIDFLLLFSKTNGKPQTLDIYYEQGANRELFMSFDSTFWGATFNDYGALTIEIDNASREPVRVVINYNNHGDQNGSVSLDNFVFRGYENSICDNAVDINVDDMNCLEGNNSGLHDAVVPDACGGVQTSRPVWYRLISDRTATIKVTTQASFNDIVDVFYGRCDDLIPFRCSNEDEYGFTGEEMYFRITEGVVYYFRVSAYDSPFAPFPVGTFCLDLEEVPSTPTADNYDYCSGAQSVLLDGDCVEAMTYFAQTTDPIPSLNEKSRADVWYSYLHQTTQPITIKTNADFADVITIYSGNCFGLQEVNGTDQGPELVGIELNEGFQYFIKVSGYFSTIEGNLCLGIETAGNSPNNDDCNNAESLSLNNMNCVPATTLFATPSGIKSSCQIKPSPDLWYRFQTPQSGEVSVEVNAEFIYDIALFRGDCDSLIEDDCRFNPHRCEGLVHYENLLPNTTYWLQIAAHENAYGAVRGELCVAVYETSNAPEFTPLTLSTELECIFDAIGLLTVNTEGGDGPISLIGNNTGDWILPGESYLVIAEDESGCRQIAEGFSSCTNTSSACDSSNLELVVNVECEVDALGLQTGRSIVNITYTGGTGQVQFFGNSNGEIVENGEQVRVAAADETGCVKLFAEVASCEPFTCQQSNLSINVDYTCIDSLLRAELHVDAQDGNGQYSFDGDMNGDLLENGETYMSIVTDEAGCTDTVTGVIACNFDSCAYSALSVDVTYDCIKDGNGNQTGQAVLVFNIEGGIGQLTFNGGQNGDTLFHGESYDIVVTDEWGCESTSTGVVECMPTSNIDGNQIPGLKVYPVPASSIVWTSFEATTHEDARIDIFDVSGKIVWNTDVDLRAGFNKIPMDLSGLNNGVYQLRIQESQRTGILKVVIQK